MDVRCPQCQTLYELEERQLTRGAVTLKCSRCQHVFRFESGSAPVQENQRRWMVNSSRDGAILYLNDFTDLHRWIMEKKVRRDDTISRTGDKWVRIGSIPEFAPIFIVVESISDLTGSPEDSHIATRVREGTPAKPEASAPAAPAPASNTGPNPKVQDDSARQSAERPRVKTEVQFPDASGSMPVAESPKQTQSSEEPTRRARPSRPTPGELPPRPGGKPQVDTGERPAPARPEPTAADTLEDDWSIGETGQPARVDQVSAEFSAATTSRSSAPMVVFVVLLLLGGGAAGLYFARPDLVEQYIPALAPENAVVALGESTADASNDAAATDDDPEDADISGRLAAAYDAALEAQSRREAELFEGAVFAVHQPLGQAVDLATSTAAKAAEGGLTDEKLAEARRALERGRLRKAENLFEEVLEFEPRNANAVAGLGFIYLEQSNPNRAASEFRRAIDLGGGDGSAYIGLGTAERQLDNPQAAYNAYDLYLGRYPRGEKASIARYQLQQLKKQLGM